MAMLFLFKPQPTSSKKVAVLNSNIKLNKAAALGITFESPIAITSANLKIRK